MGERKKHEDTTIKLDMTIEEALKRAVDAGPYPRKPKKSDTNQRGQKRSSKGK